MPLSTPLLGHVLQSSLSLGAHQHSAAAAAGSGGHHGVAAQHGRGGPLQRCCDAMMATVGGVCATIASAAGELSQGCSAGCLQMDHLADVCLQGVVQGVGSCADALGAGFVQAGAQCGHLVINMCTDIQYCEFGAPVTNGCICADNCCDFCLQCCIYSALDRATFPSERGHVSDTSTEPLAERRQPLPQASSWHGLRPLDAFGTRELAEAASKVECEICRDTFDEGENQRAQLRNCGHIICATCAQDVMASQRQQGRCPFCRRRIIQVDIVPCGQSPTGADSPANRQSPEAQLAASFGSPAEGHSSEALPAAPFVSPAKGHSSEAQPAAPISGDVSAPSQLTMTD
mmetsp:Transcript_81557/g.174781  ORF Transcript_81557/g.174781 Transcript_81557/m.174781 type:complete len:345 (+) Transcript_81557:104-1138(+)